MKPKVLVTSAAGHTGSETVLALLARGLPVRALVRRRDARSERLRQAGAEVHVGDLFDMRDLRKALAGVQRAYHCPPFAPNTLHGAALFAVAAAQARLEVVVTLGAWNPHPAHPSIHQREHWTASEVYRWMPNVPVVHVNPGLFAFPYFFGMAAAAHFGTLMLPFGEGLNAPPSNEDIAALVTGVLMDPGCHLGRSYRPTGPELLSGRDVARTMGRVLGRPVRYRDIPTRMFVKAARAQGLGIFEIAQIRHYAEEVRGGAYAVGAPTEHVQEVTGRAPEPFEVTARRYFAEPNRIMAGLAVGTRLQAVGLLVKTLLTRVPNLDRWEIARGYPLLRDAVLAHDSAEWRASSGAFARELTT